MGGEVPPCSSGQFRFVPLLRKISAVFGFYVNLVEMEGGEILDINGTENGGTAEVSGSQACVVLRISHGFRMEEG
jgi:hypothetical protein